MINRSSGVSVADMPLWTYTGPRAFVILAVFHNSHSGNVDIKLNGVGFASNATYTNASFVLLNPGDVLTVDSDSPGSFDFDFELYNLTPSIAE